MSNTETSSQRPEEVFEEIRYDDTPKIQDLIGRYDAVRASIGYLLDILDGKILPVVSKSVGPVVQRPLPDECLSFEMFLREGIEMYDDPPFIAARYYIRNETSTLELQKPSEGAHNKIWRITCAAPAFGGVNLIEVGEHTRPLYETNETLQTEGVDTIITGLYLADSSVSQSGFRIQTKKNAFLTPQECAEHTFSLLETIVQISDALVDARLCICP